MIFDSSLLLPNDYICVSSTVSPFNDWIVQTKQWGRCFNRYASIDVNGVWGVKSKGLHEIPVEITRVTKLDLKKNGHSEYWAGNKSKSMPEGELLCFVLRVRPFEEIMKVLDRRWEDTKAYLESELIEDYIAAIEDSRKRSMDEFKKNMARLPESAYGQHVAIKACPIEVYMMVPDRMFAIDEETLLGHE